MDYKEILDSDNVHMKYKKLITSSNPTINSIMDKMKLIYNIREAHSELEKQYQKKYNEFYKTNYDEEGVLYIVTPKISNIYQTNPSAYLYITDISLVGLVNSSAEEFPNLVLRDFIITRGLTDEELDKKEMVFTYIDALVNYYNAKI